jgi:hypothetical protein
MIGESGIMLALLGVACVVRDAIRRPVAFVAAIVLWGSSRVLMELTYRARPDSGDLAYDWGSLSATAAIACLAASLLCLFLACWRAPASHPTARSDRSGAAPGPTPPAPPAADASERLRQLVPEHDAAGDGSPQSADAAKHGS